MSDMYVIWLYPLQDWWETVEEISDCMYTGQMGNYISRPVYIVLVSYICAHSYIDEEKKL